jgi:hypothetical protein
MLLIVVILTVCYILIPLLDLILKEAILTYTKVAVYLVTFLWLVYVLFLGHDVLR